MSSITPTGQRQQAHGSTHDPVWRIEPCLDEAKAIVEWAQATDAHPTHQRFQTVFTALADGDPAVGLLAYYLWRRRAEQRPFPPRRWR